MALLAGTGESPEDQTIALGNFASGHVDVERFSAFTRQVGESRSRGRAADPRRPEGARGPPAHGRQPVRIETAEGSNLGARVAERLATIGNAFSAAHVVELAKRGEYQEEKHALLLGGLAYSDWSQAERALGAGSGDRTGWRGLHTGPGRALPRRRHENESSWWKATPPRRRWLAW